MSPNRHSLLKMCWQNIRILLLPLAAAVLVRKFLLSDLETRIVWVTFYTTILQALSSNGNILPKEEAAV